MIRVLIVDDEPPARAELRYQLSRFADVEVVGEAENAREARTLAGALTYDAIFLDVEMPGMGGLDLAGILQEQSPAPLVVFVTAYDQYAVPAFGLSALDYLLKPVAGERLQETVERIRVRSRRLDENMPAPAPPSMSTPLFVAGLEGDKTIPVPVPGIAYASTEGNLVYVTTTERKRYAVRMTLQELEAALASTHLFYRCHRGYLVNLHQVSEILPFFNGTLTLRMKGGGEEIPVSRGHARRLKDVFKFA